MFREKTLTDRVIRNARKRGAKVYTHGVGPRGWRSKHRELYKERLTTRPHSLLPNTPSDTLWQHITVTFDSGVLVKDFKKDMRTLEDIGVERFDSGFSYNFGIDMVTGQIGLGQFLEAKGAHTINDKGIPNYSYDQNAVSIAIAFIGMPGDIPSKKAILATVRLVAALIEEGALTPEHDYNPHSMVAAKDCPTDAVRKVMPEINKRAKRVAHHCS